MTRPPPNNATVTSGYEEGFQVISVGDLLDIKIPELHWNIQDIMPAGTMLLFGKPKKGKSFLTLMIAIAVASRRPVFGKQTSGRPVLYLALEDSQRRLKSRAMGCANSLQINPVEFGETLFLLNTPKLIDTGLIEDLRGWMVAHEGTGLITVDMLKKVRGEVTEKTCMKTGARSGSKTMQQITAIYRESLESNRAIYDCEIDKALGNVDPNHKPRTGNKAESAQSSEVIP